ncbi:MAG: acyl-CoA dehydrogenase family protein, partial [Dehalococcoidia bacterium]
MEQLLTEDERLLRSTVREFAEQELAPLAARWDENEEFPWDGLEALKRMDLMGASLPTEYGGQGLSYAELSIIHEEISRVCMTTSTTYLTHLSLSAEAIARFGSDEQKQRLLPAMVSGDKLGAFGLTEPSSGSDASDMETTAVLKGDRYVLNGAKIFITNGHEADVMVLFTSTDRSKRARGTTAFIIERGMPGFETVPMHGKMGIRGSGTANVYFNDCEVPEENRLGQEGEGFKIAMSIIDSSR